MGFRALWLYRLLPAFAVYSCGRGPHVILIAAAVTSEWKNVGIIWSGRQGWAGAEWALPLLYTNNVFPFNLALYHFQFWFPERININHVNKPISQKPTLGHHASVHRTICVIHLISLSTSCVPFYVHTLHSLSPRPTSLHRAWKMETIALGRKKLACQCYLLLLPPSSFMGSDSWHWRSFFKESRNQRPLSCHHSWPNRGRVLGKLDGMSRLTQVKSWL